MIFVTILQKVTVAVAVVTDIIPNQRFVRSMDCYKSAERIMNREIFGRAGVGVSSNFSNIASMMPMNRVTGQP